MDIFIPMSLLALSHRLCLASKGTVLPNAFLLIDLLVSKTSSVQTRPCLVVGTTQGELLVFSGMRVWPVVLASGLGTVSAVVMASVVWLERTIVVVVSVEGRCYGFDIGTVELGSGKEDGLKEFEEFFENGKENAGEPVIMEPIFSFAVQCNTTAAIMADINNDGVMELVLGSSNRSLFIYKLSPVNESVPLLSNAAIPATSADKFHSAVTDSIERDLTGIISEPSNFTQNVEMETRASDQPVIAVVDTLPLCTVCFCFDCPLMEVRTNSTNPGCTCFY